MATVPTAVKKVPTVAKVPSPTGAPSSAAPSAPPPPPQMERTAPPPPVNPATGQPLAPVTPAAVPSPTFKAYGGKDNYVSSQNDRWQAANAANDQELMSKLLADSKRADYVLNPYVGAPTTTGKVPLLLEILGVTEWHDGQLHNF